MIVVSLTSFYRLIVHSNQISDFHEDIYIGAKQVSQYVIGSRYENIGDEYVYYDRDGELMTLSLNNHRLVKTPGFEILLTDIDDVMFSEDNRKIIMNISRNDKQYSFFITYAKEYQDEQEPEETIE